LKTDVEKDVLPGEISEPDRPTLTIVDISDLIHGPDLLPLTNMDIQDLIDGPDRSVLAIVNLPGLIHSEEKVKSSGDVSLV